MIFFSLFVKDFQGFCIKITIHHTFRDINTKLMKSVHKYKVLMFVHGVNLHVIMK